MADATYGPKVYYEQGGDTLRVVSGGKIDVESGGSFVLAGDRNKGFINVPLESLREIVSNDIATRALTEGTPNTGDFGGILAKDTTPILERVNGATDKALRVKWAAANVDALTFSFAYPPDLDDANAITVHFLAKMGGATDTPTITVAYFEGVGDTDAGGATGALSNTLAEVSRSIAAGDVGAHPKAATVEFKPGTHGTDTVELHAVWIEYTRKTS